MFIFLTSDLHDFDEFYPQTLSKHFLELILSSVTIYFLFTDPLFQLFL